MPTQSLKMLCPNLQCRTVLSVPASARGKKVRCRACGTRIHVPAEGAPTPPPSANTAAASPDEA